MLGKRRQHDSRRWKASTNTELRSGQLLIKIFSLMSNRSNKSQIVFKMSITNQRTAKIAATSGGVSSGPSRFLNHSSKYFPTRLFSIEARRLSTSSLRSNLSFLSPGRKEAKVVSKRAHGRLSGLSFHSLLSSVFSKGS